MIYIGQVISPRAQILKIYILFFLPNIFYLPYLVETNLRNITMEERGNQATGHKAAMHNPNVSKEAKQHSKKVLRDEFDNQTGYAQEADGDKDIGNM